jgi:hypothetical protein
MPSGTPNPLTGYRQGRLLEEGCIQVTKTILERESAGDMQGLKQEESVGSSSDEEDVDNGRGRVKDHPNLRLQWTWSEMKR